MAIFVTLPKLFDKIGTRRPLRPALAAGTGNLSDPNVKLRGKRSLTTTVADLYPTPRPPIDQKGGLIVLMAATPGDAEPAAAPPRPRPMLPPPPPAPVEAEPAQLNYIDQKISTVLAKKEKATTHLLIPGICTGITILIMIFTPGLNIIGFAAVAVSLLSMGAMRIYRGAALKNAVKGLVLDLNSAEENRKAYAAILRRDDNAVPVWLENRITRLVSRNAGAQLHEFVFAPRQNGAVASPLPPPLPPQARVFSVRSDSGEVRYEQVGDAPFAHGGMCELFRAREVGASITRDLAVKVLMPDLAKKPAEVKRFQQEAAVCALPALQNSPYFIPFHGSDVTADKSRLPFIVMDLLDPETYPTLDQRIALPYIDRKGLSIPEYQAVKHLFVDPPAGAYYVFRPETTQEQIMALPEFSNPTIKPGLLRAHDAFMLLSNPTVQNQIGAQLTFALWFLAQQGYAHKDIKPSQVFVAITKVGDRYEVNVRLSDFGAAKNLVGKGDATETGHLMGTMTYMAPEYIKANKIPRPKRTNAIETAFYIRMDIYSLGASLFKMFSGQVPFDVTEPKDFLEYMYHPENFRRDHPLDLSRVPEAWRPIVSKMLEADPRNRYQNYEEVFADIRSMVGAQFIPAEYGSLVRQSSVVSLSDIDIEIMGDSAGSPPAASRAGTPDRKTRGESPASMGEPPVDGTGGTAELSLADMQALVDAPSGSRPGAPAAGPAARRSGGTTDLELGDFEEGPPAPSRASRLAPARRLAPLTPGKPVEELEFDDEGWGAPAPRRPASAPDRRPPIAEVNPADLLPAPAARSESSLCLGPVDYAEIVESSQAAIADPVHALRLTTILERLSAGSVTLSEAGDRSQVVALRELLGQLNEIDEPSDDQNNLKDQVLYALHSRRE